MFYIVPCVLEDKLNCSFDVTYPKESLPSPTLERVKGMAPRSDPRKRMAWITEETEIDSGSSKSDEEKYRLLLSTDQQTHKSQVHQFISRHYDSACRSVLPIFNIFRFTSLRGLALNLAIIKQRSLTPVRGIFPR